MTKINTRQSTNKQYLIKELPTQRKQKTTTDAKIYQGENNIPTNSGQGKLLKLPVLPRLVMKHLQPSSRIMKDSAVDLADLAIGECICCDALAEKYKTLDCDLPIVHINVNFLALLI